MNRFRLFMFASYFAPERAKLLKCHICLLSIRRLTMPFVFAFELRHSFAWNSMRHDESWLFKNSFRFFKRAGDLANVVAVDLNDVPSECDVLIDERLEGHDVLRISIDLNIIAINDCDEIIQLFFSCQKHCFPCISCVVLTVAHKAIDSSLA